MASKVIDNVKDDNDTLDFDFKESWRKQKQHLTECKKYQIAEGIDYEINIDGTNDNDDNNHANVYEANAKVNETNKKIDDDAKIDETKAIRKIVQTLSMVASKALNNNRSKNKAENLGNCLNESAMKLSNAKATSEIADISLFNKDNGVPNSNNETKGKEFKKSIISKNSDSKDNQTAMNVLKDESDNDSKVVGAIATKDDSWLHDDTYKVT